MTKILILVVVGIFLLPGCAGKDISVNKSFRKAIFLHHSTGANIYGLNGSSVSIPTEVAKYNKENNLSGSMAVQIDEHAWPTAEMGWNNEWYRWADILNGVDVAPQRYGIKKFLPGPDANKEWKKFLNTFPVVIIKSCFPSSVIDGIGNAGDEKDKTKKTVEGYKALWRTIVTQFSKNPDNFFVIWTNAPLSRLATNADQASNSDMFCKWAKDTLAQGKDEKFGAFPKNVYVFDFFHYLADSNGILKESYATSMKDSHPNSAATEFVAPLFVKEVFDAALKFEKDKK